MIPSRGFSLIELVMVIIVLGIISVYAMPRMGSLNAYSLQRSAQDLVEAVRYTQTMSMNHSGDPLFQIALTGNGFTVYQDLDGDNSFDAPGEQVTNPIDGSGSYTENAGEWAGVSFTQTGSISFDSRGMPSCVVNYAPCSTPSNADVAITLTMGTENLSVTIETYTGYARIN
ncbi:MAG: prepilin-type N-terminal cleavage/methylation domain-containing protein [Gammaproteobacteria bacterium]|nr:prepilin-type N-terminal cleavage/methylation domain-containing protein [Gammaproteobacteria bacterium]